MRRKCSQLQFCKICLFQLKYHLRLWRFVDVLFPLGVFSICTISRLMEVISVFGPAIPLNSCGSETLQHNYCMRDRQVTCTVGFLALIMRLWGSECLKVKIDLSGKYSQQHNTNITRLKVPSVCLTGPRALYILTSAMLLPYFRMPLSRKKYLWREQGRQVGEWNNVGIMCNISESEVWSHCMTSWCRLVNVWRLRV